MATYWRVARLPILALLAWFTASHVWFGASWVFIDYVNLALHEAGHLLFRPFGDTAHFLGGTLGQLLFPVAFTVYFARWRKDAFAAVATTWWFGENFMGIARYMADAPAQALPLVGGGIHDWNYLFVKWEMLDKAYLVARYTRWAGIAIMLPALGFLIYRTLVPTDAEVADGMDAER